MERREASSSSLRTAAAAPGVNVGMRRIATSRSHFVLGAGGSKRRRGTETVSFFSSPPRKTDSSQVDPSGPSRAALIFHIGALRIGFPSIESMRSPALTSAFSAGEPGQRRHDVGIAAAAREHDARGWPPRPTAPPCTRTWSSRGRSTRTDRGRPTSRRRRPRGASSSRSARRSWSASGRRLPRRSRGPASPDPARRPPGRSSPAATPGRTRKPRRRGRGRGWTSSRPS